MREGTRCGLKIRLKIILAFNFLFSFIPLFCFISFQYDLNFYYQGLEIYFCGFVIQHLARVLDDVGSRLNMCCVFNAS